ncbi:MAG TPA: TetR/AcrR family transcriptional regulator [Jatrophihabitantaceae bacterium]|jgi:AcrR family transcriptional regulator|nr:TetR/AcrR family transcriptional regulator [Jatrophihabitantaceae bacterium]
MHADTRGGADRPDSGPADGRRLRWTEHRSQRRTAFVTAGAVAIDRFGPDASAEQIAEVAGVSRTVLYRYFRDREDLRQAIADHVVSTVIGSALPQLRITATSTPHQVIESVIGEIIGWLDEHPNLYYFLRNRRNGSSLQAVENTLADQIAALLKVFLMFFGIDADKAEPGAYGMVGLVESTGSWWLSRRTLSREKVIELLCEGVWHLIEGTARANNLIIGYDEPLPIEAMTRPQAVPNA